jgi:hypothetical protein
MAVVDAETIVFPKDILALEEAIFSFNVAALLDGGLAYMNCYIFQT